MKYSMCDRICHVISCCVRSCDMGKINVHDEIVIYTPKKRENISTNRHLRDALGMEFTTCCS